MNSRSIDDQYKRIGGKNSYKAQRFQGKKSMKDDYTGKTIYSDRKKHTYQTAADVDHVVPLNVIKERYSDLTEEQMKRIANRTSNYAMTSAELNESKSVGKNSLQNHEFVVKNVKEESKKIRKQVQKGEFQKAIDTSQQLLQTSTKMLNREAVATVNMHVEATGYRVYNQGGVATVQSVEGRSLIYHGRELLSGREDFSEASLGCITDVVSSKVEIWVQDEINECVQKNLVKGTQTAAKEISKKVKNEAVEEFLKNMAKSNEIAKVAEIVTKAGKLLVDFFLSDMNIDTLIYELCRTGVEIAGTMIGSYIGQGAGVLVGGGIGYLIAGPVGGEIGAEIGRIVGDFVGAILGNIFINNALDYVSEADLFLNAKRELAYKIDMYTYNLALNLAELHYQHEQEVLNGVQMMVQGIVECKFEVINDGLQNVLKQYDVEIAYEDQDEFDLFMMDNTKSIVIGKV